jgi:hypothetical protein
MRVIILTESGRDSFIHPVKLPTVVTSTTCTIVCRANSVTGALTPFSADLERRVLQIAHEE